MTEKNEIKNWGDKGFEDNEFERQMQALERDLIESKKIGISLDGICQPEIFQPARELGKRNQQMSKAARICQRAGATAATGLACLVSVGVMAVGVFLMGMALLAAICSAGKCGEGLFNAGKHLIVRSVSCIGKWCNWLAGVFSKTRSLKLEDNSIASKTALPADSKHSKPKAFMSAKSNNMQPVNKKENGKRAEQERKNQP